MSIISSSRNFIFVHLRKNGGSSVEKAYEEHRKWNDLVFTSGEIQKHYRSRFGLHRHNTAEEMRKVVGEDFWKKAWTFSIVRHPASRLQSFYKWCHKRRGSFKESLHSLSDNQKNRRLFDEKGTLKKDLMDKLNAVDLLFFYSKSFPDFVEKLLSKDWDLFEKKIHTSTVGSLVEKSVLKPQFHYLSEGGELIVDDVFKLEEMDEFWKDFSKKIGVEVPPLYENKGASLSGADLSLSSYQKESLFQHFQKDFEAFSYEA